MRWFEEKCDEVTQGKGKWTMVTRVGAIAIYISIDDCVKRRTKCSPFFAPRPERIAEFV